MAAIARPWEYDPNHRLGDWLRCVRRSLAPHDLGLLPNERRRCETLTQVDVARLAGLTPRTYQRIEQEQCLPSSASVDALVHALAMTGSQQSHLRRLAIPIAARATPSELTGSSAMIDGLGVPALVCDHTWTVRAHNRLLDRLLPSLAEPHANWLMWHFTAPEARHLFVDWDREAAELIARTRNALGFYRDAAAIDAVLDRLSACSPEAASLWAAGLDVAAEPRRKSYRIRRDGRVQQLTAVLLQPVGIADPSIRISVFLLGSGGVGLTRDP